MPQICVMSAHDTSEKKAIYKKGLGILKDRVIAAHLLRWKDDQHLIDAVEEAGVSIGYGINDGAGLYVKNGQLIEIEGYVRLHYNQNI